MTIIISIIYYAIFFSFASHVLGWYSLIDEKLASKTIARFIYLCFGYLILPLLLPAFWTFIAWGLQKFISFKLFYFKFPWFFKVIPLIKYIDKTLFLNIYRVFIMNWIVLFIISLFFLNNLKLLLAMLFRSWDIELPSDDSFKQTCKFSFFYPIVIVCILVIRFVIRLIIMQFNKMG